MKRSDRDGYLNNALIFQGMSLLHMQDSGNILFYCDIENLILSDH